MSQVEELLERGKPIVNNSLFSKWIYIVKSIIGQQMPGKIIKSGLRQLFPKQKDTRKLWLNLRLQLFKWKASAAFNPSFTYTWLAFLCNSSTLFAL